MSLLTSPHQPPPAPPASSLPSPSAVPNDPQSPKQHKEPLSNRLNDFMASKPKMHCLRSLRRGVSACDVSVELHACVCGCLSTCTWAAYLDTLYGWSHRKQNICNSLTFTVFWGDFFCKVEFFHNTETIQSPRFQIWICSMWVKTYFWSFWWDCYCHIFFYTTTIID